MALPRSSLVKKPNADLKAATILPPRPAAPIGLGLVGAVPRPIGAKASAPPAPLSSRPAAPREAAPAQGPITIHPTSAPLTAREKARVETLVTQVDVTDAVASPATIPETAAAHPIGTIPDLVPASAPILTPVTPFVLHTPPPAMTPELLPPIVVVPVAKPVAKAPVAARPAPMPRAVAQAPQSSPAPSQALSKRAPTAVASKPAPSSAPPPAKSQPAPAPAASVAPPAPLSSAPPVVVPVVPAAPISSTPSMNASNKIASPWRVVTPAVPGAVPSPVPWGAPIITPAPSSATDLASCDLKVDDSRSHSLISFSDLSGLTREPMRSIASSSGSIVLGDPVIRQKMMSVVAARRRRFTGVVFSAVALCAIVCAAAVAGSVNAAEDGTSGDIVVRGLNTAKEELVVPQHKPARRHY